MSVSKVIGYGLDDRGSLPGRIRDSSFQNQVHPAYSRCIDYFYGGKAAGARSWLQSNGKERL
jgi:hypothetical protein